MKTGKTNYFRVFLGDENFIINPGDEPNTELELGDLDAVHPGGDKITTGLAAQLQEKNYYQFDQVAGIGLHKEPSITADPSGFVGNRGIPALKITCSMKVIDPNNDDWKYLLTLQEKRKWVIFVEEDTEKIRVAGPLTMKVKVIDKGNAMEEVEITGELADGGAWNYNYARFFCTHRRAELSNKNRGDKNGKK